MDPIGEKPSFPSALKRGAAERLKEIALLLLRDAAALLSAPFRASWKARLKAAVFFASLLSVMPFDDVIVERARIERGGAGDEALTFVERMGMNRVVLGVSALAMISGRVTGTAVLWETGTLALETQVFTNLFNSGLKGIFGRRRPPDAESPTDFRPFSFARGSKNSMPSAHTAHAFGLATAIFMAAGRRWGGAAYGLAGLVGAARVLHGQHYLTDVMAGAALGIYVGRILGFRRRKKA